MRFGWRLRLRDNPLRRRSDVVEAWTVLCVTAAVAVGAPAAALAVGAPTVAAARAESRAQHENRHTASARLLKDAPPMATWAGSSGSVRTLYQVPVRWTTADGVTHSGIARVPAGTRRGESARIWLDDAGRIAGAPLDESDIWLRGASVGAAAAGGVTTVALLAGWSVRRRLDRERLAQWDREWAAWV
ncbi:hypothetical protein [Streptomyces sp. VRA16 Mangrove soil]|uniref:Rv1733c family protein n=1 Tax=Streptomyces sp. VRA16 Mangrove soil TaxID=2817434 RepID=UPI001A9F8E1F|nr:hypothetical protein [Streptomyces sp. VRA16 Mangrove soil]MBO1334412.1 hypothetical protein [Streptomyces sp. VRA16 Mangrove soil]